MPFEWHHLVLLIAFAYFFLMGYSLGRQVTDTDPTSISIMGTLVDPLRDKERNKVGEKILILKRNSR